MKAAWLILVLSLPAASAQAQCVGAESQLRAAAQALGMEDSNEAENILDDVQTVHPDCAEIELDRGRSLTLRGWHKRAEESLSHYIQIANGDARGYAYLAMALTEDQEYEQADALSIEALTKNPEEPAALAIRGQLMAMKGQQDQGIQLLERACRLNPKNAEAHYQLGVIYNRAKRRQEAVAEFDQTLALVPGNATAWDYLAINLEPLGNLDKAEEAYRKGEDANMPGRHFDSFLDYNYGRFLAKQNRLKEAKEHLDRAVAEADSYRPVWYERAKVDLLLKDYPGARSDAEKAASLPDPSGIILDLQVYTLLQQVYARLGEGDLAKKYADLSRKTSAPAQ